MRGKGTVLHYFNCRSACFEILGIGGCTMDDRQLLIGKWTVWVKDWVWEYEFFPDGAVTWRDTRSLEKGTGRWSMGLKLVNLSWLDSATKESWQVPLSPLSNKRTWYSAPYYIGPYQIEKVV